MLIADGVHLADEAAALAFASAGRRCVVVTDGIAAAGLGDGDFRLGDVEVRVEDGASRRADGVLAGGVGSLAGALRRLVTAGVPLPQAVHARARRPPRSPASRASRGSRRVGPRRSSCSTTGWRSRAYCAAAPSSPTDRSERDLQNLPA